MTDQPQGQEQEQALTKMCSHCFHMKPIEDFLNASGKELKMCEECRWKGRESMILSNQRKKLGIQVSRGRPSTIGLHHPVRLAITIPRDLQAPLEEWVKDQVALYMAEHRLNTKDLAYGIAAAPQAPRAPKGQAQRPESSRSNIKGAITPEHFAFLDHCAQKFRAHMEDASRILFDMEFNGWLGANKPREWEGLRKWLKANPQTDDAFEPEPPGPNPQGEVEE